MITGKDALRKRLMYWLVEDMELPWGEANIVVDCLVEAVIDELSDLNG